ncbi:unnamed protein product [Tilletia controversa]|nr:unnamed protein product [Tilletia controversa]
MGVDIRSGLFDHATDRFPDVGWTVPAEGAEGGATTLVGSSSHGIGASSSAANSAVSLGNPREETIWAHKAILYARAPNTFQARYLNLRSASEKLGHLANNSSVSLPSIRTSNDFLGSRPAWARRRTVRGSAPPSSFGLPKGYIAGSASAASDSEDDAGVAEPSNGLRRYDSRESLASSIDFAGSSDDHGSGYETSSVSDASMASADSASTIRPPLNLEGISTEFFSSILEYLYTAEESMVEAFEFLYQDRISLGGSQEERIEKLRQDFVFMWRSKLFSDVTITLSSDSARAIRSIPDATASALSLASSLTHADGADSVAGDDETSTFSSLIRRLGWQNQAAKGGWLVLVPFGAVAVLEAEVGVSIVTGTIISPDKIEVLTDVGGDAAGFVATSGCEMDDVADVVCPSGDRAAGDDGEATCLSGPSVRDDAVEVGSASEGGAADDALDGASGSEKVP